MHVAWLSTAAKCSAMVALFCLAACQSAVDEQVQRQLAAAGVQQIAVAPKQTGEPLQVEGPLLYYTERVADRLFTGITPLVRGPVAVVSFTELRSLAPDPYNNSLNMLGLQLQESMLTVATQRGYQVKELRLGQAVQFYTDHERMLTRQLSELAAEQSVRYVIVGTMNQSEQYTTVNARMIDVQSNQVVAAASDLVPSQVLGSTEQVQLRQQRLYRNSGPAQP